MKEFLAYPFDPLLLIRQKRKLKRALLEGRLGDQIRIAILGGSTTSEFKDMLEIFLLGSGMRPEFYECDYGKYYESAVFQNSELDEFSPQVVCVFTSAVNLTRWPTAKDDQTHVQAALQSQQSKLSEIWDKLSQKYDCSIIQNNFELPRVRPLGNLDFVVPQGSVRFVHALNDFLAQAAQVRPSLHICDINYLSSWIGLQNWYDPNLWYSYKYAMSFKAIPYVAHNVAAIVRAIRGVSKKCLVLDLDHTLWGGIIGDDGLAGIKLGADSPEGEAFTDFQAYVKSLQERGVILAVCSKNDESTALEGLSHPDSKLTKDDFVSFKANWEPKPSNLVKISQEVNIGTEALVFVDDNPAERELTIARLPEVAVPNVGNRIEQFIEVVDKGNYFETTSISEEDLKRTAQYVQRAEVKAFERRFENYEDFLASLGMKAEIGAFSELYLDRIAQLVNKTNQFNLTGMRLSLGEVKAIAADSTYLTLYGRLQDKFGDNGLVTCLIGRIQEAELQIEVWVMSCRVLKRTMEHAMFLELRNAAVDRGVKRIVGHYRPLPKNAQVRNLYPELGFSLLETTEAQEMLWAYDVQQPVVLRKPAMEIIRQNG